jgi:hypothetical protein
LPTRCSDLAYRIAIANFERKMKDRFIGTPAQGHDPGRIVLSAVLEELSVLQLSSHKRTDPRVRDNSRDISPIAGVTERHCCGLFVDHRMKMCRAARVQLRETGLHFASSLITQIDDPVTRERKLLIAPDLVDHVIARRVQIRILPKHLIAGLHPPEPGVVLILFHHLLLSLNDGPCLRDGPDECLQAARGTRRISSGTKMVSP